jgi:hypothetical protein
MYIEIPEKHPPYLLKIAFCFFFLSQFNKTIKISCCSHEFLRYCNSAACAGKSVEKGTERSAKILSPTHLTATEIKNTLK